MKGTIVEKLIEETLRDWKHLKELLSICEAQRQVGETSLNETSSRSLQILRLNFVDLARSEHAAQALSVGQRLKEGFHINCSLLTLGTVIRKLSKGRHVHVNYRDSKLTRILQPCLGGNARTAIICTLSPALSHVEQSRNTLLFASCAKEVTTNAQVNVVMSDKALVKHLQKELARLESELRTPGPTSNCDHTTLLRKKDVQIEKLERELRELSKERDLTQAKLEDALREIQNGRASRHWVYVGQRWWCPFSSIRRKRNGMIRGKSKDSNKKHLRTKHLYCLYSEALEGLLGKGLLFCHQYICTKLSIHSSDILSIY